MGKELRGIGEPESSGDWTDRFLERKIRKVSLSPQSREDLGDKHVLDGTLANGVVAGAS